MLPPWGSMKSPTSLDTSCMERKGMKFIGKVNNLTILLLKLAVVRLVGRFALVVSFSMISTRPLKSSASLSSTESSVVVGIVVGTGVASGFSVTPSPGKY